MAKKKLSAVVREPTMLDVDLASAQLHDLIIALAGINAEVTASLTEEELEMARRTLIWEVLDASRKVRILFQQGLSAATAGAAVVAPATLPLANLNEVCHFSGGKQLISRDNFCRW